MNIITNQNILQKNIPTKKDWKKPILTTIKEKELAEYIKVAADSGYCLGSFAR